jgi:FAD:protein FMN transferase
MVFHSLTEWCSLLANRSIPAGNVEGLVGDSSSDSSSNFRADLVSMAGSLLRQGLVQSVSRAAMGCEFEVLLNERQYGSGVDCAISALRKIDELESLLSVYRPQSQISKVNRFGSERPVLVDASTFELVQLALDIHQLTDGAYDITAGSLSEAWGFSRRQGRMPSQQQIDQSLTVVGSSLVDLDCQAQTIRLKRPGVQLNPGGIGKGYALDQAAGVLVQHGIQDCLIHGGLSSIVARGTRHHQFDSGWKVALKHPWRPDETLETIPLRDQGLATSGSGKQFFHFKGKRYSHLIDPRTGWPADKMMSATVICPSGGVADALATGLFILGPERSIEFCQAHPEISAILVYTDPKSGSQRIQHCNWMS